MLDVVCDTLTSTLESLLSWLNPQHVVLQTRSVSGNEGWMRQQGICRILEHYPLNGYFSRNRWPYRWNNNGAGINKILISPKTLIPQP